MSFHDISDSSSHYSIPESPSASSSDLAGPTSPSPESTPVTRRRGPWSQILQRLWQGGVVLYCSKTYATNGGNSCIKRHLLEKHARTEKSSRENISAKRQRSIEHAFELSENQSFKRRKLNTSSSDGHSLDGGHLEILYIIFLTACHFPLRLVECSEFQDLLNYINNDIEPLSSPYCFTQSRMSPTNRRAMPLFKPRLSKKAESWSL